MVLKKLALLFWLILPMALSAQVEVDLEQWVEETGDEEAASEFSDAVSELLSHPVNINDTLALARVPFLSPFQRRALGNYILLYGQLLSLSELQFVPGFDSATIAWLEPLTVVEPCDSVHKWRLKDGHHSLVAAMGGTVEKAIGYDSGRYDGDRLRSLLVYTYDLRGKLNVRLVGEKDAGEAWGRGNFLAYHLMLNDVGVVEKLIAGRYNLQFGQGLTLWTGLRPFTFMGNGTMRYGSGIRQATTLYEDGYQEGLAARIRLSKRLRISAFASHALGEKLVGGHVDFRRGNLLVGATMAWLTLDSVRQVRDYLYNQLAFRGQRQFNAGLDAMWQQGPLTVFAETSVGENGAPAALGGIRLHAGDGGRISLSGRYFHPEYHNLHALPYAIGSAQGEQGVTLEAESRLPLRLVLQGSIDLHGFPSLRYGSYAPSGGAWMRLNLRRQWGQAIGTVLRYSYRQKERNVPNLDSTIYVGEQTLREQWQGELSFSEGKWRLLGRAVVSRFEAESAEAQYGMALGLQARCQLDKLQITMSGVLFNVDDYYARIYYSESNLQYAWSMPALNGSGMRGCLVLRWSPTKRLGLATKYSITYYPGEESIGSGDSKTEGPFRQTFMVQLRWHL